MKHHPDIEIIAYCELGIVSGGRTTIRAPLSGPTTLKQNIHAPLQNVTVNGPKGPVTMNWGMRTLWGDFNWSFQMGK